MEKITSLVYTGCAWDVCVMGCVSESDDDGDVDVDADVDVDVDRL